MLFSSKKDKNSNNPSSAVPSTSNYKPGNYFFIVPFFALIPWWAMLMALLICWGAQGRPIYSFMSNDETLAYISDIGATNLRPLFIACSGWQGLFYFITLSCEYFQRCGRWPFTPKQFKYNAPGAANTNFPFYMPFWFSKHERNCMFVACVLSGLGEIALLMCSIFSTKNYHHVHIAMVCVFIVLVAIGLICNIIEYFLMGKHYMIIHPLHKRYNKYTVSGITKTVWLICAIVWAICFGAVQESSICAAFEWLLAFWFGLLFINYSVDFYLGGRYKYSKNFPYVESFQGYYKYDRFYSKYGIYPEHNNRIIIGDNDKENEDSSDQYNNSNNNVNVSNGGDGIVVIDDDEEEYVTNANAVNNNNNNNNNNNDNSGGNNNNINYNAY